MAVLRVAGPFDAAHALGFLAARAVPGLEAVAGTTYRRGEVVVELGGDAIEVWIDADGLDARSAAARLEAAIPRVRRLLGLDRPVAAANAALAGDPLLGPRVRARPGIRPCGAWSIWEAILRAVVGQQVSVAGARTVLGRLVRGGALPTPAALAGLPDAAFAMPRARARTLRGLAEHEVLADDEAARTDPARFAAALRATPGVGPWTEAYVRLRALEDDDAWPGTDLSLGRTVTALAADPEAWRPWRAWAATHLWAAPG